MKKAVIILPLLLAIYIIGFIPVTASVVIRINAAYFNIFQQLQVAHNWLKWQPELKRSVAKTGFKIDSVKTGFRITSANVTLSVKYDNSNSFSIHEISNKKENRYNYAIGPDSSANTAIVLVSYKTNLLGYWRSKFNDHDIKSTSILNLKNFMENTRLYYGFGISRQQIASKLILVKKVALYKSNQYAESNKMLAELNAFVLNNQLKVISAVQMQVMPLPADSVQLLVGLPVNKKTAGVNTALEYMNMPPGKVLVGSYLGKYKDKQKIYDAMQLYIQDNYLHPLILPFERFLNNKLPASGNEIINMQVLIPYI